MATQLDVSRFRTDFATYYAPNMLKVRNEQGRIVPFILREEQLRVDTMLNNSIKHHRVFLYILKARQIGFSTWAEGRLFHRAHVYRNSQTAIMAHEAPASDNVFAITKRYYDNLPTGYKPMIRYSNRKELTFENPSKETRYNRPGLNSKIKVFTAGTKDSAHSFTFDCVHLSEFSRYTDGARVISAIEAGVPECAGNFVIMETTGNGVENFAFEMWKYYEKQTRDKGDQSQYLAFFSPWWLDSKYSKPFTDFESKANFAGTLDDEEKNLVNQFNLTIEQLHWRREKIHAYAGNLYAFMEMYPSSPEEAFITTGKPIFDPLKLRTAISNVPKPLFVGEISNSGELYPLASGRLEIYRYPERGKDYIVAVDPKGDTEDPKSDECVIIVLEKHTLYQCAEWVGMCEPVGLAAYCKAIGTMYGTDMNNKQAELVIERNNSGLSVIYELNKDYYNLYALESFDGLADTVSKNPRLGWRTDVRTKPLIVDFATFCFHNDYCIVNSAKLLDQMRRFVKNSNSASAEVGAKDDRVMAWMIALFVAGKDKTSFVANHFNTYLRDLDPEDPSAKNKRIIGSWRGCDLDLDYLKDAQYSDDTIPAYNSYSNWMGY